MHKHDLKVTVITPVLNGEETIAECLESVRSQSYGNVEHLVIDGCSNDSTLDIVREYSVSYRSEKDTGIYDAFNRGVRYATGDIIHILNADDFYASPNSIQTMVAFMTANNLDIGHGLVEQFSSDREKTIKVGKDIKKPELLRKMRVAHPATFVRKSVYENHGRFSEGFKIAADQEFLLRVWDKVEIGFIPEVIVKMRIGGISTTQFLNSYKESMAASILHGQAPTKAYLIYCYEIIKNSFLKLYR
ncbi:glycosyltransferase family 2 protein [Haliea sp. E17]|uniref:glycosyltransferase family 2 protein n=1 Tax=Haliea sp. E17 TaxID=3401576 RepID=UPI003AAC6FC7